jgi:hypothetical protein
MSLARKISSAERSEHEEKSEPEFNPSNSSQDDDGLAALLVKRASSESNEKLRLSTPRPGQ